MEKKLDVKRINVLYTKSEHKKLKALAVNDGYSMSRIIKSLIEHYMGLNKDERSKLVRGTE